MRHLYPIVPTEVMAATQKVAMYGITRGLTQTFDDCRHTEYVIKPSAKDKNQQ
jgi:hypothetical protein